MRNLVKCQQYLGWNRVNVQSLRLYVHGYADSLNTRLKSEVVMLSNQFQVNLSNEFMPFILQVKDGNTTDEKVTLSLAMGMFLSKQATLAKAAEWE